jgi:glycosidase
MRILTVLGGDEFPEGRPAMSKYRLDEQQLKRGKERLKLASTLQFTLPGVPCVFYGDEAGMEGGADPFCRRCYPWGYVDSDLISWYISLSRIRKEHGAFIHGKYTLIEARDGLFAYTRGEGDERVLVAVNMTDTDRVIKADGFNYDLFSKTFSKQIIAKAGRPAIYSIKSNY